MSLQSVETTQDVLHRLTESSDCLSNRHTPHSQAGCVQHSKCKQQLLVMDSNQHSLRVERFNIYYVSLIFSDCCLQMSAMSANIQTFLIGIIRLDRMDAFSHIGFPKQTLHPNMTCEPGVYFLPWLCAFVQSDVIQDQCQLPVSWHG